jgi:hypothetical protein
MAAHHFKADQIAALPPVEMRIFAVNRSRSTKIATISVQSQHLRLNNAPIVDRSWSHGAYSATCLHHRRARRGPSMASYSLMSGPIARILRPKAEVDQSGLYARPIF